MRERRISSDWATQRLVDLYLDVLKPYDVDVQQKLPLAPQRDRVSAAYLRRLAAEVLNAAHSLMQDSQFCEPWVRTAFADAHAQGDAVRAVVRGIVGDKAVLWSSNRDANMRAAEEGYTVLPRGASGAEELVAVRLHTGLQSPNDMFPRRVTPAVPAELTQVRQAFASWVQEVADRAGFAAKVEFIANPEAAALATCTANTRRPTLTFNVGRLSEDWFLGRGPAQLELVVHELGHAEADSPMALRPTVGCGNTSGSTTNGGRIRPWATGRRRRSSTANLSQRMRN